MEILLGTCDWEQSGLIHSYYPADLPDDWRLAYYINEYKTVCVPSTRWRRWSDEDVALICRDAPEHFHMVLEWDESERARISTLSAAIPAIVGACVFPPTGDSFFRTSALTPAKSNIVVAFADMDRCASLRTLRAQLDTWFAETASASTALIFVESPQNVAKYLQEIKILIELMGY